jgi:hypothetical protein
MFTDRVCPNATALNDAVWSPTLRKILGLPFTSWWVRRLPLKHWLYALERRVLILTEIGRGYFNGVLFVSRDGPHADRLATDF